MVWDDNFVTGVNNIITHCVSQLLSCLISRFLTQYEKVGKGKHEPVEQTTTNVLRLFPHEINTPE